jgi:hypothetical protein
MGVQFAFCVSLLTPCDLFMFRLMKIFISCFMMGKVHRWGTFLTWGAKLLPHSKPFILEMSHPLAPQPSKWTIICNKAQHFTIFVDSKVYTTHQYNTLDWKKTKFFWEKKRIGFVSPSNGNNKRMLKSLSIHDPMHGLLFVLCVCLGLLKP